MVTRTEQKALRRDAILSAGLDQFIRRGYGATKIKDIADAAQMSVGLLFHYFDSKEALYIELIRLGTEAPKAMVQQISNTDPLTFFQECAHQTLAYAAASDFTAKMFVLMNSAYLNEGVPTEARDMALSLNFYNDQVPLIQQGQADGTLRAGDPLALCTTFWSAIQGSIESYALNPGHPLPEAEWIIDIIRAR